MKPEIVIFKIGFTSGLCERCQMPFLRTPVCVWSLHVPDDLCFDCFMTEKVGEPCDLVMVSDAHSVIAVVGTAERYEIAGRMSPNHYWYGLTIGHRVEILNPPVQFRSVAA